MNSVALYATLGIKMEWGLGSVTNILPGICLLGHFLLYYIVGPKQSSSVGGSLVNMWNAS